MATTKKTPVKKTTHKGKSAKATPVKKKSVKATSTAKKTASRKSVAKQPEMRSFHIAKDQPPFTTFQITRQTVYWVILVAFIVFAQLWIISLQVEVASLLDAQQAQLLEY